MALSALLWAHLAPVAHAALPTGSLAYTQRLGNVGANEVIDIDLSFTLDAASSPLTFSSNPITGLDIPTVGQRYNPVTGLFDDVPFAPGSVNRVILTSWYACNTTFFTGCDGGGEYDFTFEPNGTPGNPSGQTSWAMDPGDTIFYRLGTLTPKAGGAAPGTYYFFTAGLELVFEGLDSSGNYLSFVWGLASTCNSSDNGCAFTRTVNAVPEPASAALAVLALGLAGVLGRRGRTRT